MGRPRKEIDPKVFKGLCKYHCTLVEIAGIFECSEDTIERWCKRELKMTFAEAFKNYSAEGKMSLRRTQFRLAEKSPAMAIFLGKQYLGQTDNVKQEIEVENLSFLADLLKDGNSNEQDTVEAVLE